MLKYPVSFSVKNGAGQDVLVVPDPDLIIREDITKAMKRQAGTFAYYAGLAEEEYRRGKRLKFKLHCLEEELDARYRKEATKRVTERALSNKIKRHPEMRALYSKYIATMRRAGHLKVLKDAFEQRYHMLQSIGANTRKELDAELRTLQRKTHEKLSNINRSTTKEQ
jgi:hypothetical protein